ncbi:hypothetical protein Q3V30_22190 (plasmid) [Erwinia pyri]|uniref:Restriction endonuclease type IV Mrr domain-containing protein n=1 Tax=Erwinia pyri TaxID=3062598 RepID=A0AA50HNK2_9GAMM|nr:hypothetical protein [Erwinia sp. DE2]WLS81168.1 hypothetical protein Q3V30_22190 [Erwinia sp. DE2]
MSGIEVEIAPPANWQDFERLTLDYAKKLWKDEYAQRHGRQGQAQAGVDIYGTNNISHESIGIQCKKKKHFEVPSKQLTIAEIDIEIDSAKKFFPKLDHFIIATTGPRDADLQGHIRMQNQSGLPFKVSLLFWDDYQDFLNEHIDLMYKYYKDVLEYRDKYNELDHYLLLLSQAFDRPAIRTSFYCENQSADFIQAMADTQNAIATGRLVDRTGYIIDECRVPRPKIKNLTIAGSYLQRSREIATIGMTEGIIIQHQNVIEIHSRELTDELNKLRRQAVELLNNELIKRDLEIVHFFNAKYFK